MAGYETWHWRTLTILTRVFGIMALLAAIGFALSRMVLVALLLLLLGYAFLRVRPYRPDLGDVEYLADPFGSRGNSRAPRHWWTGDEG